MITTSTHIDQLGRKIEVPFPPNRIISIVPSQTELLHYLGLDSEVIGITKFCIHPDRWFKNKTRIGGTKQLHIEKIRELQPDLILANKEENDEMQIRELSEEFPVWISDIHNVPESLQMIRSVGTITNRMQAAEKLVDEIGLHLSNHKPMIARTAAYFIWNNPMMSINSDTFIHDMMQHAGLTNVFATRRESRYPIITETDLIRANPEIILLSSEPFPFGKEHEAYFRNLLPTSNVLLVDGEMFSWYGSRMRHAFSYFESLLP